MSDDSHLVQPDDSELFDPANEKMLGHMVIRLRRIAFSCCQNDFQAAEGVAQEAAVRLHKEKPWLRPACSTYGSVLAWLTVVTKNIRNKRYAKQKRRDDLRAEVETRLGNPLNEVADTEDRIYLEAVVDALKKVPPFAKNKNARRLLQYQFIEGLTHEEIPSALGKTSRQLTKFKTRVYDAVPEGVLFKLFRRIRNKK